MNKPEVSIVIPNRNKANYLAQSLMSASDQSIENIEIIVVDDASTDGCAEIIRKHAASDPRVKFIQYADHKTQSQARKDAVEASTGKYILFLDSDDYIDPRTCEITSSIMNSDDSLDAVCFKMEVVRIDARISDTRVAGLNKMLNIEGDHTIEGNLLKEVFVNRRLAFTLPNKLYKGDLCRAAFRKVKHGKYPKAQDLYAAFFILEMSTKIRMINHSFYTYRFGSGIAGSTTLDLSAFETICQQGEVIDEIEEYVIDNPDKRFDEVVPKIRKSLTGECFNKWMEQLPRDLTPAGYEVMLKKFKALDVVTLSIEKFVDQQGKLAQLILSAQSGTTEPSGTAKRIGVFYHRISTGGAQRVTIDQCKALKKAGYHVCLLVDEATDEQMKSVMADEIILLPPSTPYSKESALRRLNALSDTLNRINLDVLIYHAGSSPSLLWDMLLAKSKAVRFIAVYHESFARYLFNKRRYDHDICDVLKLADLVVSSTKAAHVYFQALGVRSAFIPNAVQLAKRHFAPHRKNLIAVGRLDDPIKQYDHLLDMLHIIKPVVPDVNLFLVGFFQKPENRDQFESRARSMGVFDNITFCYDAPDASVYYNMADVFVATSKSEGFSLVLAEAKSHGVPVVCYDLPHLDLLRDNRGVFVTPQGDIKMLSDLVTKLLLDTDLRHAMSREAFQSAKRFHKLYDVNAMWNSIIDGKSSAVSAPKKLDFEDVSAILNHLTQSARIGSHIS